MKRGIAAVGALSLMSMGVANAALTTYDFDSPQATIGTKNTASGDPNFDSGLAALGVTNAVLTPASPTNSPGVVDCNAAFGANCGIITLPAGFANRFYSSGDGGTLTLTFGGGANSFGFNFWDGNIGLAQGLGIQAVAYDAAGTTILQTLTVDNGICTIQTGVNSTSCGLTSSGTYNFTGLGTIGKVTLADRGNDTAYFDVFSADAISNQVIAPEPSTYFMIGSALAGLATFRRRRNR